MSVCFPPGASRTRRVGLNASESPLADSDSVSVVDEFDQGMYRSRRKLARNASSGGRCRSSWCLGLIGEFSECSVLCEDKEVEYSRQRFQTRINALGSLEILEKLVSTVMPATLL